jgi:anaerobic selenocysteine-containing dehydrogenase
VEFASATLEGRGQPRLPTWVPLIEGPGSALAQRYPLQLLTPKHHRRFLNSSYSPLEGHGTHEGSPFVELSPADAAARDLASGDAVRVFNDRAELRLEVRVTGRLRSGVVAVPFGWWRTQHGDDQSANSLTNDTLTDWGGGVAYSDTLVEVEALED